MNNTYIYLIIILIVIGNVWFVRANYMAQKKVIREVFTINQLTDCENFDSGDLLLFRSNESHWAPKVMWGDEFGHSGIVYKDTKDSQLYVLEAVNVTDMEKVGDNSGGIKITPLYTRLSTYDGYICVKKLTPTMDINRRLLFDRLIGKYQELEFKEPAIDKYINMCVLNIRSKLSTDTTFCSLFTTRVLQDLDLMEMKTFEYCMRPQCISEIYKHATYNDDYSYSDLIEIRLNM